MKIKIICEVSAKHYHPDRDEEYTKKRDISQTGQWVANERKDRFGVIMPPRKEAYYELAVTDWIQKFGREKEPQFEGKYRIQQRHFHCDPKTAEELHLKDGDAVSIEHGGIRAGRLDNVLVRVDSSFVPRIHLDTDEANALLIKNGDEVDLVIGT